MRRYLQRCEDGYQDRDSLRRVYKLTKEELGILAWWQYLIALLLLMLVMYIL